MCGANDIMVARTLGDNGASRDAEPRQIKSTARSHSSCKTMRPRKRSLAHQLPSPLEAKRRTGLRQKKPADWLGASAGSDRAYHHGSVNRDGLSLGALD